VSETASVLVGAGVPVILLLIVYLIGRAAESSHLARLDNDERELADIVMSDLKRLPDNWRATDLHLVTGVAVIATDYFKVFAASLRNIVGGRVWSFETLVSRARREAIVRMLREARDAGANAVWTVRIETATIQGKRQGKSGGVEVMAYGTAMKVTGG